MLSKEEVLKIARLARLTLTEDEVTLYQKRLDRVLDYITELKQLKTPEDTFVKHAPADAKSLREDEAHPFSDSAALIANAPASENGSFLLPTVLDHE
jgi:aspartyl-tRNA(Asn)/glutamyl-tRNA(Gln) amidotransferase subunit C